MNFQIQIEHLVKIERIHAGNGHAQRIANKIPHVMVLEDRGPLGKQRTLVRFFHVALKRHKPVFAGLVQQVIHHFQRIGIGLLAVFGSAKNSRNPPGNLLEDVKRIGDENGADGCAQDRDQFRRLNEHAEVPMLHQIPGHYAAENHDNADDRKHKLISLHPARLHHLHLGHPTWVISPGSSH